MPISKMEAFKRYFGGPSFTGAFPPVPVTTAEMLTLRKDPEAFDWMAAAAAEQFGETLTPAK